MTLNLATLLRESTGRFPDKPLLILDDVSLSYDAVHTAAQRFAGGLAKIGVRRGQHVAIMVPNLPAFTIAYYAAHYLGAPVVPLNVLFTPDEIAYHLTDSDATTLIACETLADKAFAAFQRVARCKH
ncbi:MAG TPA: AMP-binding protein, partial [Polyangiaceae bacterium]|nr:AMP-binding protein [Polyangiaceae bacterium]